jgi:hypothetical protein
MVHLQKLQDKYGKDGLQTFAIAVFPNREKAQKLTRDMGITYPVFNGYDSDVAKRLAFG